MEPRILTLDGQTGGNPNFVFFNLVEFFVDAVTTCFSHGADKLCVPIGLSSLSALLLLLSCILLVYQRCTFRGKNPGESIILLYSFLGNLCSTSGAILSRQFHIQIVLGAFAAAMDGIGFISCCLPVLLCWNSKAEKRMRMIRGRRRQHLLAVCVLMVVAGGFLKSRDSHHPVDGHLSGRKLLHATFQDNTEILGYILGLLSSVIACTSRFPALCRTYRGEMLTCAHIFSGLLCSLASALYAAAILLYSTRFGFILRVMPWLLSAICCITLDLLILVIHWWKRGTTRQLVHFSPDRENLLGGSGIPTEDNDVMKRQRKQQVHSSARTKINPVQRMTEMGGYMDVSLHPVEKTCLQKVTLSEVKDLPLNMTLRVIGGDRFYSSDTSCESSPVSSDLEWDFEEANAPWREPTANQQEGEEFPTQRPTNPKPFCTCAMFGFPQKVLSSRKENEMQL
ncbi:transmembrane protein 44 isoform X1 [Notothenia coriiceps]|uniref:Transmembrane protein 44 isoform X1 n=1 Tax=Notothenia coriiceps TaxID=8208 RepID=A0A6I9PX78_9TELE|nr:PREDICTED: transmembrane protein 44 isoform X1 [Notothenia coriiceps]